MWSRSRKVIALGFGIGTGLLAVKNGIFGVVEAGGKAPFPQQPHCIGKECPKTPWDDDWDKKDGVKALVRTILIVAHGQADAGKGSSNSKNAKVQKVTNKGKTDEVKKLPSDPDRFIKPKNVANTDDACAETADGGSGGDEQIEGLSPLGISQVKSFLDFYQGEFAGTQLFRVIHGTDQPSIATAKMMESKLEKSGPDYENVETSLLDPLSSPLPGQGKDGTPHPKDIARLEAFFRKHFYRMPDDRNAPYYGYMEIIVCPPKLVGYFICRILQLPPDRFTCCEFANASFTELLVYRNGLAAVHRAGEIGYMPPNEMTFE